MPSLLNLNAFISSIATPACPDWYNSLRLKTANPELLEITVSLKLPKPGPLPPIGLPVDVPYKITDASFTGLSVSSRTYIWAIVSFFLRQEVKIWANKIKKKKK